MIKAPTIKLKNDIVVANFAFPHNVTFDDNRVLLACSKDRAERLSVVQIDQEYNWPACPAARIRRVRYKINSDICDELRLLQLTPVDVILCDINLVKALQGECITHLYWKVAAPCRTNGHVSSKIFCQ